MEIRKIRDNMDNHSGIHITEGRNWRLRGSGVAHAASARGASALRLGAGGDGYGFRISGFKVRLKPPGPSFPKPLTLNPI